MLARFVLDMSSETEHHIAMDYDCYCNMNEDNTNEVDLGHVEINYDSDSNQETHDALTGNTSAINAMQGGIILDLVACEVALEFLGPYNELNIYKAFNVSA